MKKNARLTIADIPEAMSFWNEAKNERLDPLKLARTSLKTVHWVCRKGHEWQSTARSMAYKKVPSCPYCSGAKSVRPISSDYSLADIFPLVAAQWHPIKNGNRLPNQVAPKSSKKAWWRCENGHDWEARISNRTVRNSGCPYCAGIKPTSKRNLEANFPEIAAQWNFRRNGDDRPSDFAPHSGKLVWWTCKKGHEWRAQISTRTKRGGTGCPMCWRHTSSPEFRLLAELKVIFSTVDQRKKIGGVEVDIFLPSCNLAIEYDGWHWHRSAKQKERDLRKNEVISQKGIPLIRFRESPLPLLSANDLQCSQRGILKPDVDRLVRLIAVLSPSVEPGSIESYLSEPGFANEKRYREYLTDLPEPSYEDSLLSQRRQIVEEFDYEKNWPLEPRHLSRGSQELIWFKCSFGHSWQTYPLTRTAGGSNCPYCSGKFASIERNLETIFPSVAEEWHPTKNKGVSPSDVLPYTNKKYWWLCRQGHEYEAVVSNRTRRFSGCPVCSGQKVIEETSLLSAFPLVSKFWDESKNKGLSPRKLSPSSGKKIHWRCAKGHKWVSAPNDSNRNFAEGKEPCPVCRKASNSIGVCHPDFAREFDYARNIGIDVFQLQRGSRRKVWWRCAKGHSFSLSPNERTSKSIKNRARGCPVCQEASRNA